MSVKVDEGRKERKETDRHKGQSWRRKRLLIKAETILLAISHN